MDLDSLMEPKRLPEKPWRVDAFLLLGAGIVLCLFGGMVAATMVHDLSNKNDSWNSTINMVIGILSFQGMALLLVHFFLREHHTGWVDGFGFNIETRRAIVVGALGGLCALPVTWGLEIFSSILLRLLAFNPKEQEAVQILRSTEGWQNRLVLGVATIIIAPVAEEILFRGILYPFIKRIGYPKLAWWVTALLFAAVHLNVATFIPLAFLAVVLIWLYEHTGNLLTCIVTHSLFNAANFIALYFIGN